MADKLTAQEIAAFGASVMRPKVVRSAVLDNDSISATDITSYVRRWNSVKFELYNKHPTDRGSIVFPVLNIDVDNSTQAFDRGGLFFPGGKDDFRSTTLRVVVSIGARTIIDFTGVVREPEYSDAKQITLVAEHPLTEINRRKWTRDDRIGGDTGINWYFNT